MTYKLNFYFTYLNLNKLDLLTFRSKVLYPFNYNNIYEFHIGNIYYIYLYDSYGNILFITPFQLLTNNDSEDIIEDLYRKLPNMLFRR
jgi:hypothetical protein